MRDDRSRELINLGIEIAGESSGAALGLLFAGPVGAVVGAIAPIALKRALSQTVDDVAHRDLSRREKRRVGAAAVHAIDAIQGRLIAGEQIRSDGFFEPGGPCGPDRSPAEEAFEGVLLKSRDQFEERKVPYIANIFVKAAFAETPPEVINRVLFLAGQLSWRQIVLLALIERLPEVDRRLAKRSWVGPSSSEPANNSDDICVRQELAELWAGKPAFVIDEIFKLSPVGWSCYYLMGLDEVPEEDLSKYRSAFVDKPIPKDA